MIRHRSGNRWSALRHVEAVHGGLSVGDAAFIREVASVPYRTRSGAEEVRIERYDHFRLVEVVNGVDVLTKGQLGAFTHRIAAERLILVPFRLRKLRQNRMNLVGQRRGSHFAGQNAQPAPFTSRSSARRCSIVVRNLLQSPMLPR